MRTSRFVIAITLSCVAGMAGDWPTDGGNPQRTNWQKDEKILNKDNVKNLKIVWKMQLDNKPIEMHSLFPPVIVDKVNTANGPKQIAIVAGVSDNIYAIDVQTAKILWRKIF
jgi:glucose dehydrogenase